MAHGSRRAVAAAIIGNFVVMPARAGVFLITGPAAMMSEAMHSLAATVGNRLKGEFPEIEEHQGFSEFSARFADDVVEELGDQIDWIKESIQKAVPKAHFLAIEAE